MAEVARAAAEAEEAVRIWLQPGWMHMATHLHEHICSLEVVVSAGVRTRLPEPELAGLPEACGLGLGLGLELKLELGLGRTPRTAQDLSKARLTRANTASRTKPAWALCGVRSSHCGLLAWG